MGGTIFHKIYGNAVVAAHLRGQRDVPFLPQEKLEQLRDQRVREIVGYAAATVPYYQKLFRKLQIGPGEIQKMQDLEKLPLLDKETVRKDPSHFVSTSSRGKNAVPFITSGTTARPLQVYHDVRSLLSNIAWSEREREVVARLIGKERGYKELHIDYSGGTVRKVHEFYSAWTFIPQRPNRLRISVSEPISKIIDTMNSFRPDAILTFGSYLEMLCRTLEWKETKVAMPRVFLYVGDGITKEARKRIEDKFGVPVISRYNSVESFKLGYLCEKRSGFHTHEDLCPIRIMPVKSENGKTNRGEIVITNLMNHGTVLLNYRLGDIVTQENELCSCGRTSAILSDLDGRLEDVILLQNGEFVHPRTVWSVFKYRKEILQYQLIQLEPERYELKLVTADKDSYGRVIHDVLSNLKKLLGDSAVIEPSFYEEIIKSGEGKFRPVIALKPY
jgi:phenylacetate-CoA ligase